LILLLTVCAHNAFAEIYGIFIRVRTDTNSKHVVVSIGSEDEREDRKNVPMEEACAVLKKVQNKSVVFVSVVSDELLAPGAISPLLNAIASNHTLWLTSFYGFGSHSREEIDAYFKKKDI